ncbi:MAG: hypothetical protein E6Q56_13110 [Mycobacterium sp.]|nr:MAG: hypothetical protein E6Q56_13110 [Mycobacterium sp.]
MNTTTILAKLAAVTGAVAAPVMLFLGAGSATATGSPSGGPDNPENSPSSVAVRSTIFRSVPSVSHPDFDWRPVAPAARPGSPRPAPALGTPPRVAYPEPQIKPRFEPETF